MTEQRRGHGRRQLLLLASLFLVPVLAATLLYLSAAWRPTTGAQHGLLLDPPRPLPEAPLVLPDGSAAPDPLLRGRWSLVYVGAGACDAACTTALVDMRQVRLALDKDAARVQRVFLYSGDCCGPAAAPESQPGLLRVTAGAEQPLLAAFAAPPAGSGRIHVVDPLGNLLMSYPPGTPPRGILEDLERLLRLSRIG